MKLVKSFYLILLKTKLEYRFNFFMEIFINLFTYVIDFLVIWIIMQRFQQINGWTYYQVIFLYNMNLFTYGSACLFFYIPMRNLEYMVYNGTFESFLIRPISPFWHLLLKQNYLGFLSHIVLGIIMFCICFSRLSLTWSLQEIVAFCISIIGGILIQASVLIFTGSLNIKFVLANSFMDTLIYDVRSFIEYPISIFPKMIQVILTFFVPYAFVNFYPANYFFGKQGAMFNLGLYGIVINISLGGIMFISAVFFFNKMLNNYEGVGH